MYYQQLKVYIILTIIAMLVITGCNAKHTGDVEGDSAQLNVVTSFYPLYDFANKIGGEYVHVINLIPAGVDPHDWSPKLKQLATIIEADMFIYNGLGFEGWVDGVLSGLHARHSLITVEASAGVDAIEGHHHHHHETHTAHDHDENIAHHADDDARHNDDHDESAAHDADNDGVQHHDVTEGAHGGYDPHIWLSPLQAKIMASNIKDGFIKADAEHEAYYMANYERLISALDQLHEKYATITDQLPNDTLVVSHEAYGYLARDYGLQQMGVMGLSSSSEPTIKSMRQIIDFIKDHHINYILFEELTSPKLAQTIADDLGIDILMFNTLEGLKNEQIAAGEDYVSIMEQNLISIEKALQ